jgi:hypothetical protein
MAPTRKTLRTLALFLVGIFAFHFLALPAEASHFRGGDLWVEVEANGALSLYVKTRWRHEAVQQQPGFPFAGIDAFRINGSTASLRIYRVNADGTTTLVKNFTAAELTFGGGDVTTFLNNTTTATTISSSFDERVQRLIIPIGTVVPAQPPAGQGRVVFGTGLNLAQGNLYSIEWMDNARIGGLRNADEGPFGLRTRILWNGTKRASPKFNADVLSGAPRGYEYSQNLNAFDPDGESVAYAFSPTNQAAPFFGPATRIPGGSLDQFGNFRVTAAATTGLLDNFTVPTNGADYVEKFIITSPSGELAERDILLDAVNRIPPTLDAIGNRTIETTQQHSFTVTGQKGLSGATTISLRATGLPAGATFTGGTATTGNSVVGTFTWTPTLVQLGVYGINFEVVADYGTAPQTADSELVQITVTGSNRPPALTDIANLRVGVDPLNVLALVSDSTTFDAFATDPNTGDVLTYSLPVLINPSGQSVALSALGASIENTTGSKGRVGRITIAPPPSTAGVWQLRVRVDDGNGSVDEEVVAISVGTFTNASPTFSIPPQPRVSVVATSPLTFTMEARDPNLNQVVTLSAVGLPSGATFVAPAGNPSVGTFSWTPTLAQAGDLTVRFEARDNGTPAITETTEVIISVLSGAAGAPVRITLLTPNEGLPAGGTSVVMEGQGFTGTVGVTIGGNSVTNLNVLSTTRLSFDTPPGPEGQAADVTVTSSNGAVTLDQGYLYVTRDTIPPYWVTIPSGIDVEATSINGATVTFAASASDTLDGPRPVVCTPASGTTFALGNTTVSCSSSDVLGNTATASFLVSVRDTTPPSVTPPNVPPMEATSAAGAVVTFTATAFDIVSGNLTPVCTPASGSTFAIGTTVGSCTATDGQGNSTTSPFFVTVKDTLMPVVTVPNPITTEATSAAGAVVTFTATALDAIDGSLATTCSSAAGSVFALGSITVTCTATDNQNNTGSASFTITVQDTTPPVVTVPAPITVEATSANGAMVSFTTSALDVVDGSIATSCPASSLAYPIGTTTLNCTATDARGNIGTASFTVTVSDSTAPVVTVPAPITVEATSASGAVVTFTSSALDVVGGSVATTCTTPSGSTFAVGSTSVSCSATDSYGNTGAASFLVSVADTTAPAVTAPVVAPAEATSPSGAVVSFTATATDLVDGAVTPICTPASGSAFAVGTTTASCTATDSNGNSGTASFQVTVQDTTPPVVTVPAPITAEATVPGGATVTFASSASDIVDGNMSVVCSPASGTTFAIGSTTVACTATDAANNTGSASFSVSVQDTTAPVITVPSPITTEATGSGGATVSFATSAADMVDGSVATTCTPASGTTFAIGTTTVTCTATDSRANSSSADFSVTVQDTTPPVVTVPAPITLESSSASGAVATFTASASDIVDGAVATTCTPASGATFAIATTTVTCTATDARNNTGSASFTVTVNDTIPPVVTVPAPITAEATGAAGAVVTFTASALDGIDGNRPTTCSPASGSTFAIGTTPVTCSATDNHSNTGSASFNVTIQDTTPPVLSIPASMTLEAGSASGRLVDWGTTGSDIVDGFRPVVCTPASGSPFAIGITTVDCTTSDTRGNTSTGSFTVTINDTTRPDTTLTSALDGNGFALSGGSQTLSPTATFGFGGSDLVGVTSFECSIDGGAFVTCASPRSYSGLTVGSHTFRVQARDAAGNVDALAAELTWSVITPGQASQNLTNLVTSLPVPASVANSLSAPLGQANTVLNDGNPNNDNAACGKINAFINQVDSKVGNGQLTPAQGAALKTQAQLLLAASGC